MNNENAPERVWLFITKGDIKYAEWGLEPMDDSGDTEQVGYIRVDLANQIPGRCGECAHNAYGTCNFFSVEDNSDYYNCANEVEVPDNGFCHEFKPKDSSK